MDEGKERKMTMHAILEGHTHRCLWSCPANASGLNKEGLVISEQMVLIKNKQIISFISFLLEFLTQGHFLSDVLTWWWLLSAQCFQLCTHLFLHSSTFSKYLKGSHGLSLCKVLCGTGVKEDELLDSVGFTDNIPGTQMWPWGPQQLSCWLIITFLSCQFLRA